MLVSDAISREAMDVIKEALLLIGCLAVLFALTSVVSAVVLRLIYSDTHDYDEKHVWLRRIRD